MADFWRDYQNDIIDGYFKENKKSLKHEFIVDYAKKIALQLKDSRRNKLSQLWKFYDHARRIQDILNQEKESLDTMYAELYELMPAVNYAKERDTVTWVFKNFIDYNVRNIHNNEDLNAFIKHFQSVIAYLPRQNQK